MQQTFFTYPTGFDCQEQLQTLHELKDTFVHALFGLCDLEEDMVQDPRYQHLQRLYLEAHQQEYTIKEANNLLTMNQQPEAPPHKEAA